jgi:chromosome segregation ATPase
MNCNNNICTTSLVSDTFLSLIEVYTKSVPVTFNIQKGQLEVELQLRGSKGLITSKKVPILAMSRGGTAKELTNSVINNTLIQTKLEQLEQDKQEAARLQKELEEEQAKAEKAEQNARNLEAAEANAAAKAANEAAKLQQQAAEAQLRAMERQQTLQRQQQATQSTIASGQKSLAQREAEKRAREKQLANSATRISTPTKSSPSIFSRFNPFGKKVVSSTARRNRSNQRNTRRRH